MAEPTITLGWESQVDIQGSPFAVTAGGVDGEADEHECGDSESRRRKKFKGGRQWLSINLDFQEDKDVDLHADPGLFEIVEGDSISVRYYPQGRTAAANGGKKYLSESTTVFKWSIKHDVNGKVTGHLEGKNNDGLYTKASEVLGADDS